MHRESGHVGNDVLYGGGQIHGGEGWDTIRGWGALFGEGGANRIYGSEGEDWIFGGDGHDWLFGMGGDDYLSGGAGHDWLDGGEGAYDRLFGGSGDDVLDPGPRRTYFRSVGNLTQELFLAEEIDAGTGTDIIVIRDDGRQLEGGSYRGIFQEYVFRFGDEDFKRAVARYLSGTTWTTPSPMTPTSGATIPFSAARVGHPV